MAMVMRASMLALAFASACGIEPRDGQFLCPDGQCPDGQRCDLDGVCRVVAADVDGGGTTDGATTTDGAATDGATPTDGGPTDEVCAPDPTTGAALDEDRDGEVDEGCAWHFGTPHLVPRVHVGPAHHFALALSADALRAYVSYGVPDAPVYLLTRTSVREPFVDPPVAVGGTARAGRSYVLVTITSDELLLVAQTESGFAFLERKDPRDAFFEASSALTTGFHPALSPDGLDLYFTVDDGPVRRIHRMRRSDRGSEFGTAMDIGVDLGSAIEFPRVSSDGQALFYRHPAGLSVVTREGDGFSEPTRLPTVGEFVLAEHSTASREVWLTAAPEGNPAIYKLWRAQVCRDGPCPEEARVSCTGGIPSFDGFHCYFATDELSSWEGSEATCQGFGAELASIASAAENTVALGVGTGLWLGLSRRSTTAPFGWSAGEPILFGNWGAMRPSGEMNTDCGYIDASGTWTNTACATPSTALCEREALPTWLP
jgi:hypothetical protein